MAFLYMINARTRLDRFQGKSEWPVFRQRSPEIPRRLLQRYNTGKPFPTFNQQRQSSDGECGVSFMISTRNCAASNTKKRSQLTSKYARKRPTAERKWMLKCHIYIRFRCVAPVFHTFCLFGADATTEIRSKITSYIHRGPQKRTIFIFTTTLANVKRLINNSFYIAEVRRHVLYQLLPQLVYECNNDRIIEKSAYICQNILSPK